jgi:hypothetical protein
VRGVWRVRLALRAANRWLNPLERHQLRSRLAPDSRYYGGAGTIHRTRCLDVETFNGTVVSVWFRCQLLPFQQVEVHGTRATEMEHAYGDWQQHPGVEIVGLDLVDRPRPSEVPSPP